MAKSGILDPGKTGFFKTPFFVCFFRFQIQSSQISRSTARVSSRKYFIPGCVGRGLDLDLRIRPAPAASGNPSGWAQAGPKWVGPSRAQVGGPKLGPRGWAQAGPKWVGPSRAQVGGPRIHRFGPLGIEVEKQGFRTAWLITGRKFP